jgi:hypothetical protein
MADSKVSQQNVCFSWVNNGKCKFGDQCRYFHPIPKDVSIFGICLDFARGITRCRGPEFCLHAHPVGKAHSKNPCQFYVAGNCGLGWACPGDHCALAAAAEFTSHGIRPPQFLLADIKHADKLWGRELMECPINALKFLATLQQFFLLLFPCKNTTRGLAKIIAEYAVSKWDETSCDPYRSWEGVENSLGYTDISCSFPGPWNNPICSFCRGPTAAGIAMSINHRGAALCCVSCIVSGLSLVARLDLLKDVSLVPGAAAALELYGCSPKDTVLWFVDHPTDNSYVRHSKDGCILALAWGATLVSLRLFTGLCPGCLKR